MPSFAIMSACPFVLCTSVSGAMGKGARDQSAGSGGNASQWNDSVNSIVPTGYKLEKQRPSASQQIAR
ncbi:hypothetical protein [Paracoccus spongiarum]|uniref:Uncharacterized protein n=1 Tax=Paracoccus spongiarum TaxID=3064387 RepID=A0ABT9J8G0_9RHOB|nr:hypothetical protein [Paracoccus sp. 2205BS29-5]MDP5306100.1 hypothetical protein [Paracoccus sp. 2205BS29-5]